MTVTEADLKKMISAICRVPEERIARETRFVADLHMDSLASLDLLTELEEVHGVVITQEEARHLQTFGHLLDFLEKRED